MTAVWKTTIPVNVLSAASTTVQRVPAGARRVHTGHQRGAIATWWEVPDVDAPKVAHYFQLFPTGAPIGEHLTYVATVQLSGGDLVIHVYEAEPEQ